MAANLLFITTLCLATLIGCSQQLPLRSHQVLRRNVNSPNQVRDLRLGLRAMAFVFSSAKNDANPDNLTIEISRNSTYKTVADSLCSLAMYSDFLAATSDTSISFKLQALQSILEQNVKDGCNVLKNQSLHSKEVNFTTAETQSGSEDVPNEIQCTNEDLTALRVYCIRESLSENIVEKPYFDIARALPSSSIHNQGVCDWIGRRFQELERSEITDSATAFNCASI